MSREIFSHKVNGLNQSLKVEAIGDAGAGGANTSYLISPTTGNASGLRIDFHSGPVGEAPPKGLTNESLLAVIEDRLIGFQAGQFACRENAIALTKIQEATMWLQKRTRDRDNRGVEGSLQK